MENKKEEAILKFASLFINEFIKMMKKSQVLVNPKKHTSNKKSGKEEHYDSEVKEEIKFSSSRETPSGSARESRAEWGRRGAHIKYAGFREDPDKRKRSGARAQEAQLFALP